MKIDIEKLYSGDRRTLSKALTLIESNLPSDLKISRELLKEIAQRKGHSSIRLAITGAPGVGKSTLIDTLGTYFVNKKKSIAVLAIDPSSPIHGGSLLGDKTRMETLSQHPNAFIRPSPSKGIMGGIGPKTMEAILICEAAGFDYIIVETVGVGQSETIVSSMVDLTLLLLNPGGGDDLQGIKKGIMEVADIIAVNKADSSEQMLAEQTASDYHAALSLLIREETPNVLTISSLQNKGITELAEEIDKVVDKNKKNLSIQKRRLRQNEELFWRHLFDGIKSSISSSLSKEAIQKDPLGLADTILEKLEKNI